MCLNITVILPTVERFLLLYPLQCGSILIMFWTMLRSIFCMVFYSTSILEVLIGVESPFGAWLSPKTITHNLYIVYYMYLFLLLSNTVLFVFTIYLAVGLFNSKPYLLQHYLVCRFVTWLIELLGLFILCLADRVLIGYHLGILFFVILEFYAFIIVYSYYVSLLEDEKQSADIID